MENKPQEKLQEVKAIYGITFEIKQFARASFCAQGYDVLDLLYNPGGWIS